MNEYSTGANKNGEGTSNMSTVNENIFILVYCSQKTYSMRVMRTKKDNGLKPLLPLALMPVNMSNLSRDLDEAICYKNVCVLTFYAKVTTRSLLIALKSFH